MRARWPNFNVPEGLKGLYTETKGGTVHAKKSLLTFQKLSLNHGANLIYSTRVNNISENTLTLSNGTSISAKNIIICCGHQQNALSYQAGNSFAMETYHYADKAGIPVTGCILPHANMGYHLFWSEDGPEMKGFKVGYEEGLLKSGDHTHKLLKEIFKPQWNARHECFYSMTEDSNPIFKKKGPHIFATALNGRGFKFMPNYGPIIHDMINGVDMRVKL